MHYVVDYSRSTKLASTPVANRLFWHQKLPDMDMTFESMWKWSDSYTSSMLPWRTYKLLRLSIVPVPSSVWYAPYGYGALLISSRLPAWAFMEEVDKDALEREVAALSLSAARVMEIVARAEQMAEAGDPSTAGIVASQQAAATTLDKELRPRQDRLSKFLKSLESAGSAAPMRWTVLDVGSLEEYVVTNELLIAEVQAELSLSAARREIEMGEAPLRPKALNR